MAINRSSEHDWALPYPDDFVLSEHKEWNIYYICRDYSGSRANISGKMMIKKDNIESNVMLIQIWSIVIARAIA